MNITTGRRVRAATGTAVLAGVGLLPIHATAQSESCHRTPTTIECREGDYWTKLDLTARTLEAIKEPGRTREVSAFVRVLGQREFGIRHQQPGRYDRILVTWDPGTAAVNATPGSCGEGKQGVVVSLGGAYTAGSITVTHWDNKQGKNPRTQTFPPQGPAAAPQLGEIVALGLCGVV